MSFNLNYNHNYGKWKVYTPSALRASKCYKSRDNNFKTEILEFKLGPERWTQQLGATPAWRTTKATDAPADNPLELVK